MVGSLGNNEPISGAGEGTNRLERTLQGKGIAGKTISFLAGAGYKIGHGEIAERAGPLAHAARKIAEGILKKISQSVTTTEIDQNVTNKIPQKIRKVADSIDLILDSAVQDAKAIQDLESESLLVGAEHSPQAFVNNRQEIVQNQKVTTQAETTSLTKVNTIFKLCLEPHIVEAAEKALSGDTSEISTLKEKGITVISRTGKGQSKKVTLVFDKVLGEGAYGTVHLGYSHKGTMRAVKVFTYQQAMKDEAGALAAIASKAKEAGLTKELKEHFVMAKSGTGEDDIVGFDMPLADKSLKEEMKSATLEAKAGYLKHLIADVAFLHELGFIHGDIKEENALVHNGRLLLCDFGLTIPDNTVCVPGGTHEYKAPEIRYKSGNEINKISSDCWSLGEVARKLILGIKYDSRFLDEVKKERPDSRHNAVYDVFIGLSQEEPGNRMTAANAHELLQDLTSKEIAEAIEYFHEYFQKRCEQFFGRLESADEAQKFLKEHTDKQRVFWMDKDGDVNQTYKYKDNEYRTILEGDKQWLQGVFLDGFGRMEDEAVTALQVKAAKDK